MAGTQQHSRPDGGRAEAEKALRLPDLILFAISAIVVVDTVGASAAIGVSGLLFWLLFALLFFVPYGLITAELAAAWPDEGGIYVWVRRAFGPAWASLTAWLYWINIAYWMPSVFVLFAGTLSSVFLPGLGSGSEALLVTALIWLTIALAILDIRWGRLATNVSAVLKVAVFAGLGTLGIVHAIFHGSAESFGSAAWIPRWDEGSAFLPVIVFSLIGFELMSSASSEIRNPQRNVPLAIGVAGVSVVVLYLLATVGILTVIPAGDVNIVTGIADAFAEAVGGVPGGAALFYGLVIALLVTFLGNTLSWAMGASRTFAASGLDSSLPALLSHRHPRFGTPDYALLLMGAVATAVALVNYQLFAAREDLFWTIFAVSSVISLLPYVLLFPAAYALRRKEPNTARPFRVPGGSAGILTAIALGEGTIIVTLGLLFIETPPGMPTATYLVILAVGTVATTAAGLALYGVASRSRRRVQISRETPVSRVGQTSTLGTTATLRLGRLADQRRAGEGAPGPGAGTRRLSRMRQQRAMEAPSGGPRRLAA